MLSIDWEIGFKKDSDTKRNSKRAFKSETVEDTEEDTKKRGKIQ